MDQLLREQAVLDACGRRKTALWDDIKRGTFTRPVRIGAQAVAWPRSEVSMLIAARIGGLSDDQLQSLVKKLEAKRRVLAEQILAEAA
jgi:prophage regulatory protein